MKKNLLTILMLIILYACPAYSQLPSAFVLKQLSGKNINEATALAHAPDGRIFIAERGGNVKVYQNGTVTTVHSVSTTTANEQGLLGITLHPQFATNGQFYIFYTNAASTVHYLDRVTINAANQVTATTRIMEFDPIINGFHNGGAILFKDNYLYVAIGESNSPAEATKLDTYRGKILRLTDAGQPAPGNPYYNTPGASRQQRSIWAIGMRNPWKMALDPVSGKIYVVNVGGNYEEIDDVTAPDSAKHYNYGWDGKGQSGPEQPDSTIAPVFAYPHDGWGCAITSGVFFNPTNTKYPAEYKNRFYFSDWCADWFKSIDPGNPGAGATTFSTTGFRSVLGTSVGLDGNIYFVYYGTGGSLYRLEYDTTQLPVIVNQPQSQSIVSGDPVAFSVTSSGALPLTYQWQKNGVNIAGATADTFLIAAVAAADAANYRCIVSNSAGKDTSDNAKLTVLPFNARPVPHISAPLSTRTWNVGDTIHFAGTATDAEDGTIPAAKYQWEVRFYHQDGPNNQHYHPGPAVPNGVTAGTFIADNGGETSPNVWLRIMLTVTDSQGRTGVDSLDIIPNKVNITAASSIPGLQLILGAQNTAPFTKTLVVNTPISLEAVTPQVLNGKFYEFASWSNGGAASQVIRVPAKDSTFTATYTPGANLQNPYFATPTPIPGKIEIENFDLGGEGIAYHDNSTGNAGNQYRTTEDVDLENCAEGGFNIGYVAAGEWLEYTIDVTTAAQYTLSVRVANPGAAKTMHVELDGQNISGNITVPATGGFQAWQTVSVTTPVLSKGVKVLRVSLDATDFNVNYLTFALAGSIEGPVVSLTSPANNTTFSAGENIEIDAAVSDATGAVTNVEFYQGATKIGEDADAPYTFTWTNAPAGTYSLTAKATDNQGLSATSIPVSITVSNGSSSNLALNKNVTVSGNENGVTMPGSAAVDGDINTRWSSAFEDPSYIYVDLGARYNISEVKITWENAKGKDYLVQVADTVGNWHNLKTVTGNNDLINDHTGLTGAGRYVQVYGTARTTGYGYSIFELEVYGNSAARIANYTLPTTANASQKAFRIYPNPVYNYLTISGISGDGLFNIVNVASGQNSYLRSEDGKIDVSRLTPGTYIIQFKDGEKKINRKFIKL
ncbi:PQQ-dependent sugar dehydrogenase [Chitinophaga silvisoli]|uniref:T9SS C-terminal target domain-containing protein n=1 Tax=Chitinophaga silvisoli TaxID=2291814 RepID=A0A3E1P1F4_9BACT|nr:PQQ-dependent sugar dehydrogenase [Chitinophaga silvisoli]RFM33960.1 T9SS C-terminal target domain-containing protein [Chitinophaga silvisoli]